MTPNRDNQVRTLGPDDAATLDALLECLSRGDAIGYREIAQTQRGQAIVKILGLIAELPAEDAADDLVPRTMARIAKSAASLRGAAGEPVVAVGQTDFDILDALLGAKAAGDLATLRQVEHTDRGRRVGKWLDLVDLLPAGAPSEDLVARTMARIAKQSRREAVLAHIDDHRPAAEDTRAIAFRWRELISVAAMLMIAVSLLWPITARTRSDAMRIACAANLSSTGVAMGAYARDNQQLLPRYATTAGSVWWNVGKPSETGAVESNSAHLYKLRRERYTTISNLNCPTNGEAPQQLAISAFDWPNARAISYSYQNQYSPDPVHIGKASELVVLADKNPLFTPSHEDQAQSLTFDGSRELDAPGNRHAMPGQNALVIDGSVRWTESPSIKPGGDNFYTAGNVSKYQGTETPAHARDSFLVP